jgi:membrane protein YqaA with SNARE-associated domain
MNLAALIWGFAEATLFFIVPDVLLSWIALDQPRKAWVACGWAVGGALAGGAVMYAWGAIDVHSALAALEHVPAVSRAMCAGVGDQIQNYGIGAVFLGPIRGAPYKIYAVQAGACHINIGLFLVVSVPARLIRFALVTGLTVLITRLFPRTTVFFRRMVHIALWTIFYAWYFAHFLVGS